jgi:5,6-dimethylbenzimidazole synthase
MGWVSILEKEALKSLLGMPPHVVPVAYLCLGYVTNFARKPELEGKGWRRRLSLADLIASESWANDGEDALKALIRTGA